MAFTTRKSLLEKVRNGDEISWREFYEAYKPLILLCGQDCRLTPEENDDLVQQVMAEIFFKDILGNFDPDHVPEHVKFQYDPRKGRFRHYLRGIIRNQALKIIRKRKKSSGDAALPGISAPDDWNRCWDDEWRKHLMNMAAEELKTRVQPETYVAFEMYALQGRPVEDVASFLNMSVASVYTAKCRCVSMLREIIAKLEEQ